MDSYYAMLKVTRESKFPEDVKKSYRRLSLKAHPDKGGSEADFQALNRAYEVLKDDEKRAAYDRFGFDLGDDSQPEDLVNEIGTHVNKALGTSGVRSALAAALCVTMRTRLLRTAAIAVCGGAVVYGKHRRHADLEKMGFRFVPLPLVAWAAHAIGLTWLFDAVVYAVALGCLELEVNSAKGAALVGGFVLRWLFGSRLWMFVKLLLFHVLLLILAHCFFVLVAAVVKEIVDQKLKAYGQTFRKLVASGDAGGVAAANGGATGAAPGKAGPGKKNR
mmetsp:Transcript_26461/g.79768  ORF Transcript_26461/g.79768 Transcript_26461/m.79768 type:complete len:276 (+) Transcript_26461:145-972(+)